MSTHPRSSMPEAPSVRRGRAHGGAALVRRSGLVRWFGLLSLVTLVTLVIGPAVLAPAAQASAPATLMQPATAARQRAAHWEHAVASLPSAGSGCFQAAYPELLWHRTHCHAAPHLRRAAKAARSTPRTVGTGNDYAAEAVGGTITSATGTFTDVSPGITETSRPQNQGTAQPTVFSLQMNTQDTLKTSLCATGTTPASCTGWEQFVYTSETHTVSIQYWLLTYGKTTCPATWTLTSTTGSCVTNSPAVPYTGPKIGVADLGSTVFTASATKGGTDVLTISYDGHAARLATPDSRLFLAGGWSALEFNVFGNATRAEAVFGPGTTIEPEIALTDGALSAPTCQITGTTGETNNLTLSQTAPIATRAKPTAAFVETNQGPSAPSCATVAGSLAPATPPATPPAPAATGTPIPAAPVASKLAFVGQPKTVRAGQPFTLGVAVKSAKGSVVTSSTAAVSLHIKPATGSRRTRLTCRNAPRDTTHARAGVARFTCTLSRAGRGYVLVATSPGLTTAASAPLTSRR